MGQKLIAPWVSLESNTKNPIETLYIAYRTCYSEDNPQIIKDKIERDKISKQKMESFVEARLTTGHMSPLEQVTFDFYISNISRACSHQLVRHRVGTNFEQQSQRYVTYKNQDFPYILPRSIKDSSLKNKVQNLFGNTAILYEELINEGVPAEDARFLLPNATSTNLKLKINLAALIHMGDIRLCTRSQWEFRKVVSLMRAEVVKVIPILGKQIQPKCGENRMGYCDEEVRHYNRCPISKVRPHKEEVLSIGNKAKGETGPLSHNDFIVIQEHQEA